MKVLIIEDEMHNAKRLHKMLEEIDSTIDVLDILEGVDESVHWFKKNLHPDLVFMDVRLTDGLSFDIFSQVEVKCPIIFTSAFDEYALRDFKVNSVDYLLKPIKDSYFTVWVDDISYFFIKFKTVKAVFKDGKMLLYLSQWKSWKNS